MHDAPTTRRDGAGPPLCHPEVTSAGVTKRGGSCYLEVLVVNRVFNLKQAFERAVCALDSSQTLPVAAKKFLPWRRAPMLANLVSMQSPNPSLTTRNRMKVSPMTLSLPLLLFLDG